MTGGLSLSPEQKVVLDVVQRGLQGRKKRPLSDDNRAFQGWAVCKIQSSSYGSRTRDSAVRGQRLDHLTNEPYTSCLTGTYVLYYIFPLLTRGNFFSKETGENFFCVVGEYLVKYKGIWELFKR